jgi:transcriptional regulator with XRE-family HTH domain
MIEAMGRPRRTDEDRELMVVIGTRLRWVREAMDISQEKIALAVGVDQTTWSLYEKGKRTPDQFRIPQLIGKLGITVPYLLGGGLDGVERDLAIQLAARHPELADTSGKGPGTGKAP